MQEKEKKITTLDDVARELGVSKTTVSRAISGKGRISRETREKVQRFVEEHDYRPSAVAKGLAQKKTYNLGLILPGDYKATEFPFFRDCMNGICEVASDYDYDILISMVNGEDLSQIQRMVINRKVDGMILSRAVEKSAAQKYLKENGVPFVVIGPNEDPDTVSVDNENREACEELTEIILMKGIHRIALLGGRESYGVTRSRYQGFLEAHKKLGIQAEKSLIMMNIDNRIQAGKAVERALEARAGGILCMDDFICDLTLQCLRERQIQIPKELKIASFYESDRLEYNHPPITGIRFDTIRLGKNACRKLLRLLGENPEEEEQPSGYQVILRESTK